MVHARSEEDDGDPTSARLKSDASHDRVFADAVRLARSVAGTSMAAITLIDDTHLWFLASSGFEATCVPKKGTFCERTVAAGKRSVVEDALQHPEFATRDFVVSKPRMRYYAGMPMVSRDREVLGTLCVADQRPNLTLDDECFRHLALILEITTDRLEQHRRAAEDRRILSKAQEVSRTLGIEAVSISTEIARMSATARAHELSTDAAIQGVRQMILLDREIHDGMAGVPRRTERVAQQRHGLDPVRSQLQLHNAISLALEDDIDTLVGAAATLRMRSTTLEEQGQRLAVLTSMLDDVFTTL